MRTLIKAELVIIAMVAGGFLMNMNCIIGIQETSEELDLILAFQSGVVIILISISISILIFCKMKDLIYIREVGSVVSGCLALLVVTLFAGKYQLQPPYRLWATIGGISLGSGWTYLIVSFRYIFRDKINRSNRLLAGFIALNNNFLVFSFLPGNSSWLVINFIVACVGSYLYHKRKKVPLLEVGLVMIVQMIFMYELVILVRSKYLVL